jgi:DNA-binding transcriptional regulator YhcF (GntR family)
MSLANPKIQPLPGNVRAVLHADDAFLLRKIDNAASGMLAGDYLVAFIWVMLTVLNVRHLSRAEDGVTYAGYHDYPPDEQRRPVSMYAAAKAMRLPYETLRRHIVDMERRGMCVRIPGKGVVVPTAVIRQADDAAPAQRVVGNVLRFIGELKDRGFDFSAVPASRRNAVTDVAAIGRAIVRLDAEYTCDVIEILYHLHSELPNEGVLYLSVALENTRGAMAGDSVPPDGVVPDAMRRPVPALAISNALHIPYETVRRTLNGMAKSGKLQRTGKQGFIVPAEARRALETDDYLRQRYNRLLRYVTDLHNIGVELPR